MKTLLISLAVGAAAGLLGALCGIGGGIVMVPAFTQLLGLEHKQAVATSLAIIIITALVATANNSRAGLVDWRIVLCAAVGAAAASWFGSDLMQSLQSTTLTRIFGITLLVFGAKMLIKPWDLQENLNWFLYNLEFCVMDQPLAKSHFWVWRIFNTVKKWDEPSKYSALRPTKLARSWSLFSRLFQGGWTLT